MTVGVICFDYILQTLHLSLNLYKITMVSVCLGKTLINMGRLHYSSKYITNMSLYIFFNGFFGHHKLTFITICLGVKSIDYVALVPLVFDLPYPRSNELFKILFIKLIFSIFALNSTTIFSLLSSILVKRPVIMRNNQSNIF